jgi:hypothetical protein
VSGESWLRLKADPAIVGGGRKKLLWAMWNVQNDFIFNKSKKPSFLQVIHMATHWIRMWFFLQPVEERHAMDSGSNCLETVAQDLYNQCGWRLDNRINY